MGAERFQIETDCINQLAVDGYGLTVNCKVAGHLRRRGLSLVDLRHVLATGDVVHSDMLEDRGLWIVFGDLIDGGVITITVAVRSADQEVEIMAIA